MWLWSFPGGSVEKNPSAKAGEAGLIPGWGRSPAEGNGNPLLYSCLENFMGRGDWWATVHGVTNSRTQLNRLITHTRARTHLPRETAVALKDRVQEKHTKK